MFHVKLIIISVINFEFTSAILPSLKLIASFVLSLKTWRALVYFTSSRRICKFNAWQMLHDLAGFSSGSRVAQEKLMPKSWSTFRQTSRRLRKKKYAGSFKREIGTWMVNKSELSLPQVYFWKQVYSWRLTWCF